MRRANLVNVDGMDAVDNSVNGIRSTVSQEAVQEFQVLTSNYNAEYGRASGGVINIVSKSGSNGFHGNAFGYWRNNALDATNPFSTVNDPSYTRAQYGFTLGGALKKDKTFYFFSFEGTRRQETGFTSIGRENFGLGHFDFSPLRGPARSPRRSRDSSAESISYGQSGLGLVNILRAFCGHRNRARSTGNNIRSLGPFSNPGPISVLNRRRPNPGSYIAMNSLVGNYPDL